jgi:hypothetical protein
MDAKKLRELANLADMRQSIPEGKTEADFLRAILAFDHVANPAAILALLDERDALLSIVRDAGLLLDMLRTGENGEKYDYVSSRHKSMMLVGNVVDDACQAIAKAEAAS